MYLEVFFGRRDVVPEQMKIEEIPSIDPIDMALFEKPGDPDFKLAGLRLGIVYKDYDGNKTQRVIRLQRLQGDHYEAYIYAYCELRQENRSFLMTHILGMFDPSSGEFLEMPATILRPLLMNKLKSKSDALSRVVFEVLGR